MAQCGDNNVTLNVKQNKGEECSFQKKRVRPNFVYILRKEVEVAEV